MWAMAQQQMQHALTDVTGAIEYVVQGENEHPNRLDICQQFTGAQQPITRPAPVPAMVIQPATPPVSQPSAPQQPVPQPSPPQPTQGQQPPAPQGRPMTMQLGFHQPSSRVGEQRPNSQPAPQPTGGAPSAAAATAVPPVNIVMVPPQPNQPGVGQPSLPGNALGARPVPSNPFDEPAPPAHLNPFAAANAAPAVTASNPPSSVGSAPSATTGPVQFPANDGLQHATPYQPGSNARHPDITEYSTRDANNRLLTWKGLPVKYIGETPCFQRPDTGEWTKIWFPNGPPAYDEGADTPEEMYDEQTKEAYQHFFKHGHFPGGRLPQLPPRREWNRWDM